MSTGSTVLYINCKLLRSSLGGIYAMLELEKLKKGEKGDSKTLKLKKWGIL